MVFSAMYKIICLLVLSFCKKKNLRRFEKNTQEFLVFFQFLIFKVLWCFVPTPPPSSGLGLSRGSGVRPFMDKESWTIREKWLLPFKSRGNEC